MLLLPWGGGGAVRFHGDIVLSPFFTIFSILFIHKSNPFLQLVHWQSDALTIWLNLIRNWLNLIRNLAKSHPLIPIIVGATLRVLLASKGI